MQNSLTAIERRAVLIALRRVQPTSFSASIQACPALSLIADAIDSAATRDELLAIHANVVQGASTGAGEDAELGQIVRAVMVRHALANADLRKAA